MLFRPNNNNRGVRTAPSCRALRVSYRPLTKFNRETLYEMNRSCPIHVEARARIRCLGRCLAKTAGS